MKLSKDTIKNAIAEVIEENYSADVTDTDDVQPDATVEESDESEEVILEDSSSEEEAETKIDIYDDAALLKYLREKFLNLLNEVEGDFVSEGGDYDEDTGRSWTTYDFDEEAVKEAAWDDMESVYDDLSLDWTDGGGDGNDAYAHVESFMSDHVEDIESWEDANGKDAVEDALEELKKVALEDYEDGQSYARDPYAYYGVSRSDFM